MASTAKEKLDKLMQQYEQEEKSDVVDSKPALADLKGQSRKKKNDNVTATAVQLTDDTPMAASTKKKAYYSRPELGAESESLYSEVQERENDMLVKSWALRRAQRGLEKTRGELVSYGGQLDALETSYKADPSKHNADLYNAARNTYNQMQKAYSDAEAAYNAAYDAYMPTENAYKRAVGTYQRYTTAQQRKYEDWRGTIRDSAVVKQELDAVEKQLAELRTQQNVSGFGAWLSNTTRGMIAAGGGGAVPQEQGVDNSAQIAQLEQARALLQEEYDWGQYLRYADLMGADDFREKSQYASTANGLDPVLNGISGTYTETGFDDLTYDYINRNEDARGKALVNSIGDNTAMLGLDKSYLQQMKDEEIGIFNYLYATQGPEAAYKYTAYLTTTLNQRQRMEQEEQWAKYAKEHPVASSAFSVLTAPAKGLSYIGQAADFIADGEIDQNAAYNKFSYANSAIRGQVAKQIEESGNWGPVGSFAYQTGMSMADFLFTNAITGGNQTLSLAVMGSGAAADTTIAAKDRGLEDWQAFTLGTVAGLAEAAMEKVSLDVLLDPNLLRNGSLQYIIKNMVAEGSEEVGTDVINLFADILISQDKSEWQKSIDAYVADGKTIEEALGLAMLDQAVTMGLDFLGGAISGGIMSGGSSIAFNHNTSNIGKELGKQNFSPEDVQAFVETGLESDPDTDAYKIAKELQAKVEAGQKISDFDLSRQYQANVQAVEQEQQAKEGTETPDGDEVTGLQLPGLEDDTQGYTVAPLNNETGVRGEVNGSAQSNSSPVSLAEKLRREQNLNGGIENVNTDERTAGPAIAQPESDAAGASVSDGGQGRYAGQSAGKQTGFVAGGTGRSRAQTPGGAKTLIQRQNAAGNLRRQGLIQEKSSSELGVSSGTETKNVLVYPTEAWDQELYDIETRVHEKIGCQVSFVMGKMEVNNGAGKVVGVRGVYNGNDIIVQIDNAAASATQIADHEIFHAIVDKESRGLVQRIKETIIERFTEEEFAKVYDQYFDKLWCVYGVSENASWDEIEAVYAAIAEELFADAYAGINAFGAGADQFAEIVKEEVDQLYVGKLRDQENGTENPTGPPLDTYSYDEGGYEGRSLTDDPQIYTYDFLSNQPDMDPVYLPDVSLVRDDDGKIDHAKVVSEGMKNALSVGTERAGKIYVKNRYTGRELWVTASSVRHGLNGGINRLLTNARLGSVVGDVVKNAIPINALHNTAPDVEGTYAMAGFAMDDRGREFVAIITVEQRTNSIAGIEIYDLTHAVSGRQKRSKQVDTKSQGINPSMLASKISIADLLEAVKNTYRSILSEDVLRHMGETKSADGYYSGRVRYSYAGENANNANLDALSRAKEMQAAGVADETIRQETGWFVGMDGKWRWEIDDSKMRYTQRGDLGFRERNPGYARYRELLDKSNRHALELSDEAPTEAERAELNRLSEIWRGTFQKPGRITEDALPQDRLADYLQHDELFEAYPQLRKTTLRFADLPDGTRGQYDPSRDFITLDESMRRAPEDTLVHEIQHAIQNAEGFASGSSTRFWDNRQVAKPEYASEIQAAEQAVERAEAAFRKEWADDINLDLVKQYVELDNQLWDEETDPLKQQELADQMEQIEQIAAENGWEDLLNDYYYAVGQLQMAKERAKIHRRTSIDLYHNTAGEIEARDVTARRSFTPDQRRSQIPARGDENTVFAENGDDLSLRLGERFSMGDVDSHGRELTQEQQEYFAHSQARDDTGRLLVLYHQTDGEFTIFDTRHAGAGSKDSDTPFGIFLKRSAGDIGLAGKKQMALYANITNPLRAANREDLIRQLREISDRYAAIADRQKQLDYEYHEKFEQAKKAWQDYITEWRAANPGANRRALNDDPKFNELFDAEDDIVDEWTAAADRLATEAKEIITADLRSAGYDGVFLENDVGSWNRQTDAIIALDPQQVKDVSNKTPTNNPDIRYSVDDGQAEQEAQQKPKKKTQRKKQDVKPVAESKPLRSKRELRNTVLSMFSIPSEKRAELGAMIDSYADRLLKNGSLTEQDRKNFFDRMYDSGVMTVPADDFHAEARNYVKKGKIYVSESVRAEFGDDWNNFRKQAFGAGVYLTSNRADAGIDQWNAELAETLPGFFDSEDTDLRSILERIIQVAEEGKDEKVSLQEYTARLAGEGYVSEDEFLDNMERQLDWALRTFAEKASLEIDLRDRTGKKISQEREGFAEKTAERSARQKAREAQRRADEREARKESARRARERKELRELQQKTLKQLQWLNRNRNRAPEELKAAWDEVLGDIDLYAVGAANEMRWSEKHNATWKDLAQMYKDAMKNDPNFLPSKELERIVARLDGTKIAEMDLGALQDLYKAAIGLRTEFYNRNNVINDEMNRLFGEVYADAKREIETAPGGFTGKVLDKFLNLDQLTPMNVLQRMAGWDPNGAFYSMAKQLERGERDMRAYSVKAQKMLQDFLTEHEDWVKIADGQGKDAIWYEVEVPQLLELGMGDKPIFGPTVKVYMTPAQKVHMYLESKNLDNLRHMTGGRTFVDKELYSQGKRQEALSQGRTIKLAPETVRKLVSDLTAEEMELAKILDQYYNTFATQEINKVSNILYGYDKAMGKNYAPIYTNRNYTKTEFGVFDTTAEGVGNLKGRQYAVNPSYNISAFDAFERHVDQTARFCGMAIPARNWTTLMNWREKNNSTGDVITHKWGEESKRYITDLITTLQAGDDAKTDTISSGLSKLQSNYITAIFGANPSIVLKQLGSIPLAGAYLDARNMPTPAQIAKIDRSLISKYTKELDWRTMGYATPETKQLKDNPNWTQTNKVFKFVFGGGAITAMDGWAASTLWPWAENKVRREHPELEVGTQEQVDAGESAFYKKVAEEFDNAVSRSQSVSDEIHQGTLRKSKNPITKAFTMFRSDSAQTYNALRQKIGEARYYMRTGAKDKVIQTAKKAAGTAFVAMLLNAAWSEAVSFLMAMWKNKSKYYRDDEDELTFQSVAGEMVSNMFGSFAGVVTGGEELFELIGNIVAGDTWYGIETPGMEQLNDLVDVLAESGSGMRDIVAGGWDVLKNGGNLGDYFSKHSGQILGGIKNLAEAAAMYLPGLPASNLEAYLVGAMKWISPELGAAYDDLFSDTGKSDLAGMEGNALEGRVGRILSDRKVSESDSTAATLAALYEAGYKTAIPGDTPASVSINGEKKSLGAYKQQAYDTIWGGVVADALDDMVASDSFAEADPKTQAKMLSNLYAYAAERAKDALFDEYEMDSGAAKNADIVAAGATIAECIIWNTTTSEMKSGEKSAELVSWDLPEGAKRRIFLNKISDSREDSIAAFEQTGLSFDQFLQAYSMYGEINSMDLKAGQKAVEFSHWVNAQGYSDEQAAVVKDELTYFSMTPASSNRYDELVGSGMDPDDAYDLTGVINDLQPEDGADKVSDLQKWRASVDFSDDVEDQLVALSAVMTDAQFQKVEIANNFGVSPDAYITLQETKSQFDADGNGDYKQTEIQAAIDGLPGYYTTEQKAVLWQLATGSTSSRNNPYSRQIGQEVLDAKADARNMEDDELPGLKLGAAWE